jgi:hypothetical protein
MRSLLAATLLLTMAFVQSGCGIAGFGGAMIESYRRNSTKAVEGEYHGLKGKNWAVVVAADRAIQGEHPDLVVWLTAKATERLVMHQDVVGKDEAIGAAGFVKAEDVLKYQYEHPGWIAMPKGDLAKALGVERLIYIEVLEYRLNEPGNQYLWSGLAAGNVDIYEADSEAPDEAAFQKSVRVGFPDKSALGPSDLPRAAVATELGRRFVDRVTWVFYRHQEPYYPKY